MGRRGKAIGVTVTGITVTFCGLCTILALISGPTGAAPVDTKNQDDYSIRFELARQFTSAYISGPGQRKDLAVEYGWEAADRFMELAGKHRQPTPAPVNPNGSLPTGPAREYWHGPQHSLLKPPVDEMERIAIEAGLPELGSGRVPSAVDCN